MRGVLDRMEDGIAVILVEEKREEFTISEKDLPAGSETGTWFQLEQTDGNYAIVKIDEDKTAETKKRTSTLAEKLQVRKKTSKFKRK